MKQQIVLIHGGEAFQTRKEYLKYLKTREVSIKAHRGWAREYLDKQLGSSFEIIRPQMPCKDNAFYEEWAMHFERHFPFLRDNIVLIGNSLGAAFLAKWLAKNIFPKKIAGVFLVCPPHDNWDRGRKEMIHEFAMPRDLSGVFAQCGNVHFFFSENDMVVPIAHKEKFEKKLPEAQYHVYKNKNGHFLVPTFPEIVKYIKQVKV